MDSNRSQPSAEHPDSEIDPARIEHLLHQQQLYQTVKPELLPQYRGQYIAFENGLVLDSDRDDRQLMRRLYTQYGHRDIFVEYVCDPEPQLSVSALGCRSMLLASIESLRRSLGNL